MDFPDTRLLRLIAFFKVVKAATLIMTGVGILKMVHVDPGAELYYWATNLVWIRADGGSIT
jgi:hypothetical protein